MKRNEFIRHTSLILGATIIGCKGSTDKSQPIQNQSLAFDLHTHPGVFFTKGSDRYPGDKSFLNRVKEMKSLGLDGAFFSLVADWPLLKITDTGVVPIGTFTEGEGWQVYKTQLDVLKKLLTKSEAILTLQSGGIDKGNKIKAYISSEGGDFLDDKIEHVAEAYEDGLRSIQLVHYAPNTLGDLQTWKAQHGGLSSFGKEVVKEMNKLGMIIDVAHASVRTVKNVVDLTTSPIILSHSILKEEDNRPASARAISIDHAKMVAGTGGVIGMWPSGFSSTLEDFVDSTLRMVDVVGIDHVGIGTDMDANFKPVINNYNEFFQWRDALIHKGLSQEEVGKITGGNAHRILKKVLG